MSFLNTVAGGLAVGAGGALGDKLFGGSGAKQQTGPWKESIPYLQETMRRGDRLMDRDNWTDAQGYIANQAGRNAKNFFEQNYGPRGDITEAGVNLFEDVQNGNYTFNPEQIGPIQPQFADTAMNNYDPNAVASTYDAAQVGGPMQVNAGMINPNQFSGAPQVTVNPSAGANMKAASMDAAVNSGYTPDGQVKQFMEGGAYDNQFLDGMYNNAARQMGQNFQENIVSGITDREVGDGQYGGSRGAIAEGIAARGQADALGGLASNMYGNAYNQGFGAMSNLVSNQQQGGINASTQNANNVQQANATNAGNIQQANATNASNIQQNNQFNADNQLRAGIANQNAGLAGDKNALTATLATLGAGLDASKTNASNLLTGDLYNATALNNAGQFNANAETGADALNTTLEAGIASENAGALNTNNRFNSNMDYNTQSTNANNVFRNNAQNATALQQDLMNQSAALGLPNQGLTLMDQAANTAMGNQNYRNDYDWGNLLRYGGLMGQMGGLGGQQSTENTYSPAQQGILAGNLFSSIPFPDFGGGGGGGGLNQYTTAGGGVWD